MTSFQIIPLFEVFPDIILSFCVVYKAKTRLPVWGRVEKKVQR